VGVYSAAVCYALVTTLGVVFFIVVITYCN
jgi:hypothetical protein